MSVNECVDKPRGEFFHSNWTGAGGRVAILTGTVLQPVAAFFQAAATTITARVSVRAAAFRSAGFALPSHHPQTYTAHTMTSGHKFQPSTMIAPTTRFWCASALVLLMRFAGSGDAVAAPATESLPHGTLSARAGDLSLRLRQEDTGIRLLSLQDAALGEELLSTNQSPLFTLTLRQVGAKEEVRLVADEGWRQTALRKTRDGLEARWEQPVDASLAGIAVTATAHADQRHHAWRWKFRVENRSAGWSVWRVAFPQLALADFGARDCVFVPQGSGVVKRNLGDRTFTYTGKYTDAWCVMQFMAAYREGEHPTGLYVAMHDPWGSRKEIVLHRDPGLESVRMKFDHPAPDMGRAGNDFVLSGEGVWQLLRGDWFDAAQIYKAWARKEAKWWPPLTAEGRADTPLWMRELNVWAQANGTPEECVTKVKDFQEFLGVPVGFHWYGWHQIPGDNDYPHYFPAVTNFTEGVRELQRSRVFVMPYINGRLWDTHDQGTNDWQFTRLGRPAASKKENGEPYIETYASKESTGEKVRLAVMCPTTARWQQTVSNLVLRLLTEVGTSAVYIDQVAAATPMLCMDATHGHPLGGGHWWNEGYWKMLKDIRRAMPPGAMLTSECNAEPFIRGFDGYLTWTWARDGQVPAFPAVYGGTVQMFGRSYGGGETKDLALRVKAAQQLVFGEQIGWLDPGIIKEKENAEFFKRVVIARSQINRYFYASEMARPPKLIGNVPSLGADWQWSGHTWITNDVVLTGAWQIPKEKKLVMIFANVSDEPVTATVRFDPAAYGIRAKRFQCEVRQGEETASEKLTWPLSSGKARVFERQAVFKPRRVQTWELRW